MLDERLHSTVHETRVPQGIAAATLLDQVRNTAPYLFEAGGPRGHHLEVIREYARRTDLDALAPFDYFRLCLAAHWTTVATPVPTDVDIHIRFKLWNPSLTTEELGRMAELVLAIRGGEPRGWDSRVLSRRFVESEGEILSGHDGEWFSVAAAAYGALRRRDSDQAARLGGAIANEILKHVRIYKRLLARHRKTRATHDALDVMRAATLIAHNLGDLSRVFEQWQVGAGDALYDATVVGDPWLTQAGELNTAVMAVENHRHFALRKPRCVRRTPDLLVGIGPFFDDWGMKLARHPALSPEEVGEVVSALVDGWEKLPGTVGYVRAIAGVIEAFPGGLSSLCRYVPAKLARTLRAGELRRLTSISRGRFEEQWARRLPL